MDQITPPTPRDTARNTVSRYLSAVATGTPDDIAALFAQDATVEDPAGTAPIQGRDAIRVMFGPLAEASRTTELLAFRYSGDTAAFHFRVRTIDTDGTTEIEPIDVMTIDSDGYITSSKAYWSVEDVNQL